MTRLLTLAVLLCAAPLLAQSNFHYKAVGKFERKAAKLASADSDFGMLTPDEQELLIKAVASKLEKLDAQNRRGGRYKEKADGVSLHVFVTAADLEALKAKYPYIKVAEKQGRVVRESQTQDAPTQKVEDQAPQFSAETVKSPDFHSLFADNAYALDDTSCDAGRLAAVVDQAAAAAGKDGKVEAITIESSASTLRDTITDPDTGKPMTFRRLSELRAEQARDFVLKRLTAAGQAFPAGGVAIDAAGANGDGTSGPADPYGTGGKGDGTPPLKDVKDYDRFKYVHVSITVTKVAEETPAPKVVEVPGQEHSQVIAFDLDSETRCRFLRCLTLPTLRIARRVSRRNWGSTKCPRF